jgi:hypothetical protein
MAQAIEMPQREPITSTTTLPGGGANPSVTCGQGSGFRGGDFSAIPTSGPGSLQLVDPVTKQPFANNIIPCGRIDPAAAKINALLPAPNQTGTLDKANFRQTNNYFQNGQSAKYNSYLYRPLR